MNLLRKTYHTFAKSASSSDSSHDSRGRSADVLLEGYLARPSPTGPKKRWAVLQSSGVLKLYQSRASPMPYQELKLEDFNSIVPSHGENTFVLRSTLLESDQSLKFITYDAPSQRAWVASIKKVFRNLQKTDHRTRASISTLRDSIINDMNAAILDPHQQTAVNELLEQLEQGLPTDPLTAAQSSGEPVACQGYLQKRGSINPSFKTRWFVLTELGRMVYFANNKSSRPTGQLSLATAELCTSEEHENTLGFAIRTDGRQWVFRCESQEELVKWLTAVNRVFNNRNQWTQIRRVSQTLIASFGEKAATSSFAVNIHDQAPDVSLRPSSVKVAVVTWNLAERFPDMEHLDFLRDLRGHDIIVVGVQEFQPVIATVGLSAPAHHHTIWEAMIASMLGPRYGMPGSCAMGAVHIAVFTRREILPTFSNLQTSSIACGIGNVLTNKGAVAIKFNICDVSVCFTCAHLCCGTEKVLDRNNDFHRVDAEVPQALLSLDRASMSHFIQTRKATYKHVLSTRQRKPRKARSMSIVEKTVHFRANTLGRSANHPLTDMVPLQNGAPLHRRTSNGATENFNPLFQRAPENGPLNPAFQPQQELSQQGFAESCRLAVSFDCSFFLGDLNYRISADGAWLRYMLRVADQLETLEALTKAVTDGASSVSPQLVEEEPVSPTGVDDNAIDTSADIAEAKVEIHERDSRELKMAVLLSAISNRELRRLSAGDPNSDSESEDDVPDISDSDSDSDEVRRQQRDGRCDGEGGGDGDSEDDDCHIACVKECTVKASDIFDLDAPESDFIPPPPSTPPPPPPPPLPPLEDGGSIADTSFPGQTDAEEQAEFDPIQVLRNLNIYDATETAPRDSLLVPYEQLCTLASEFSAALKFVHRTGIKNTQAIYERLLQADQLIVERQRGEVFASFEEAQITFKPSYKFDKYTKTYDTSKKNRSPAWCDRIMFACNPLYTISPDRYFCVYDSCHSDHRPVVGTFTIHLSTAAAATTTTNKR